MTGRLTRQLHHPFAQVRINHVHPLFMEKLVKAAFFRQHRLAFHHPVYSMFAQNGKHDRIVLCRIRSPVDLDAVCPRGRLELLNTFSFIADAVSRNRSQSGTRCAALSLF